MNTIIRRIIVADKAAQEMVDKSKAAKIEAQTMMTSKKEEIYASFMAESQKEIDQKKAELSELFKQEKAHSEEKYKASLESLQRLFDEKKDEWIQTIVQSCLGR